MSAEQRTEEARLLYVAVTRAGHELIITSAATRNGKQTGPSPWLSPIESTVDNEPLIAVPAELVHRATAPADELGPLRAWRAGMARVGSVSEQAICSDRVLTSLLNRPPATVHDLATRLSVSDAAAERWWPRLAALLSCDSN